MTLLSFAAPFVLMLFGFVLSVAAGAARDVDLPSPTKPLTALLAAAILLTAQAVLWVHLGTRF